MKLFKKVFLTAALIMSFSMTGISQASPVVIGGKNFTEQLILAEITNQYLKAKGFTTELKTGMGSSLLRKALESKQVHVYWEYTGTAFLTYHKNKWQQQTSDEIYKSIKAKDAKDNIVWLDMSKANNTYALAMRSADAKAKGISTMSDYAKQVNSGKSIKLGLNVEFYKRADGFPAVQKTYKFKVPRKDVKRMDSGLVYKALKDKDVDVGLVFATDGRIPAFNFTVLKDDKQVFPAYALTPNIRKETLDANPKLGTYLNKLSSLIGGDTMAFLNAEVDVEKKSVAQVASEFLKKNGLN